MMKANIAHVATPDFTTGIQTWMNDRNLEQPSIIAASSSSTGTPLKNPIMSQATKGSIVVRYMSINAR